MILLDCARLFAALAQVPNLQRRDWERNQSGTDRGLEAVLIQRSPRELATFALARLRIASITELREVCQRNFCDPAEAAQLSTWGLNQGGAVKTLANMVKLVSTVTNDKFVSALATLRYYRCREEPNPVVQRAWTEAGLERASIFDCRMLDEPPIAGAFWQRKLEKVKDLIRHVQAASWVGLSDTEVVKSLRSVVGEQTASMVALFWLGRPIPVLDSYLERLLRRHGLLPESVRFTGQAKAKLGMELVEGADRFSAEHTGWSPARVLSCLYLWACELGRLHCDCRDGPGVNCPLPRLLKES